MRLLKPLQETLDWQRAKELCEEWGMQLFFPDNWSESVSEKMKALNSFWIGLRRGGTSGEWIFVNGTVLNETAIPFSDVSSLAVFEAIIVSQSLLSIFITFFEQNPVVL